MEKDHKYINVKVDLSLYEEFREAVPWGLRGHLFASILRLIVDAIQEDGLIVTGAILSGEYKLALALRDTRDYPKRMENSDAKV